MTVQDQVRQDRAAMRIVFWSAFALCVTVVEVILWAVIV